MSGTSSEYSFGSDIAPYEWACVNRACSMQELSYSFTAGEFLTQEVVSSTGSGQQYLLRYTFDTPTTAQQFYLMYTQLALPGARAIGNGGALNYHPAMFVSATYDNNVTIDITFDLSQSEPTDQATTCGFVAPAGEYTNTTGILSGYFDSILGGGQTPGSAFTIDLDIYTGGKTNLQTVKTVIDDTVIDKYYIFAPGYPDHLKEYVPTVGESIKAGLCDINVTCSSAVIGQRTVINEPDGNVYNNIAGPFSNDPIGDMTIFGNAGDGIVIDNNLWAFSPPGYRELDFFVKDSEFAIDVIDDAANTYTFGSPVLYDFVTDPTGAIFASNLQTELQNVHTTLGIPFSSIVVSVLSADNFEVHCRVLVSDTNTSSISPYMEYANTTSANYVWANYNKDYQANYQHSIATTDTLLGLQVRLRANIPAGKALVLGLNVNGIFGDNQFFTNCNGTGALQDYTYVMAISGTDPLSGAYTLTSADLVNMNSWVYIQQNDQPTVIIDGIELTATFESLENSIFDVMPTTGCNDNRRDDLLNDIKNALAVTTDNVGHISVTAPIDLALNLNTSFLKSFSVSAQYLDSAGSLISYPTGIPTFDISFDDGSTYETYIDGTRSYGDGDDSLINISQVWIKPSIPGGRTYIHWEQ